jgi:hypothetical protein
VVCLGILLLPGPDSSSSATLAGLAIGLGITLILAGTFLGLHRIRARGGVFGGDSLWSMALSSLALPVVLTGWWFVVSVTGLDNGSMLRTVLINAVMPAVLLAFFVGIDTWAIRRLTEADANGSGPMTPLLPLSAYLDDQTGYWRRARRSAGLWFGAAMGAAALLALLLLSPMSAPMAVVTAIGLGTLAGLGFGFSWAAGMRKDIGRIIAKLHRLDREILPVVPESGYSVYLPCSHQVSEWMSHGGVLFAGPAGLLFQPHRLLQSATLPAIVIPRRGLALELTHIELTSWRRHLVGRPEALRATWDGHSATFVVPRAGATLEALREALGPEADALLP